MTNTQFVLIAMVAFAIMLFVAPTTTAIIIAGVVLYQHYSKRDNTWPWLEADLAELQQLRSDNIVLRSTINTLKRRAATQASKPAEAAVYPTQQDSSTSLFWEYTDEGFVPASPRGHQLPKPQSAPTGDDEGYAWL